jgi:hypothetical protein
MAKSPSDDTADMTIDLSPPPTQPGSIDPAVLRRAMKYGQKAQKQFDGRPFRDVEADLRAGWILRGESTEWEWVRAAIRAGYEQDLSDE